MKSKRDVALKMFFDWKIVLIEPVLILLKFELVVRTNLEKVRDSAGSVWVNSQSIKRVSRTSVFCNRYTRWGAKNGSVIMLTEKEKVFQMRVGF